MNSKLHLVGAVLLGAVVTAVAFDPGMLTFKPKDGFVPTEEVAIKIAVAVWEPWYGVERVASEKPYKAGLTNGVWTVESTIRSDSSPATAQISKADGRILGVGFGRWTRNFTVR
jgi:hypothetical protein